MAISRVALASPTSPSARRKVGLRTAPPEFGAEEVKLRVVRRTFAFPATSGTRRARPVGSIFLGVTLDRRSR